MRLLFALLCCYLLGQVAQCLPYKTKGQAKTGFKVLVRDNSLSYISKAAHAETKSQAARLSKELATVTQMPKVPSRPKGQLKIFFKTVTWFEAKDLCEEDGGYLGAPENRSEELAIAHVAHKTALVLGHNKVWLGANDLAKEGQYLLGNNCPLTYSNFAGSIHDNFNDMEDCIEMFFQPGPKWNDQRCWSRNPAYVCRF